MASIQKLKNGWRYRVSYKEGDEYKTKTKGGFRTKRECEIVAAELEKKLHVGHSISAGDQLFSEYMRNWFDLYKKGKYSPEHVKNIDLSVKLVEKHFPNVRMKELTKDMYQLFLNEYGVNHATETVRKRHIYIRSCIKDAIEDGVITKDPTNKASINGHLSEKSEELKFLNFEELITLVAETKKDMKPKFVSRYIILFAIATGARFSEIIGMTWDCVDFEQRTISITKSWDYKYTHDFSKTKTFASKRTITIDKETCDLLKGLKKSQSKMALQTQLRNSKNLCFINSKMELISNNAVNKTLRKLCARVGAKEMTCHALRHTHASMLLYKGVNIKYVSRRLGHKDIVTTLQTYSHVLDEMEQKESRQVDDTMNEVYRAK